MRCVFSDNMNQDSVDDIGKASTLLQGEHILTSFIIPHHV